MLARFPQSLLVFPVSLASTLGALTGRLADTYLGDDVAILAEAILPGTVVCPAGLLANLFDSVRGTLNLTRAAMPRSSSVDVGILQRKFMASVTIGWSLFY
jgi:hypothetical protein